MKLEDQNVKDRNTVDQNTANQNTAARKAANRKMLTAMVWAAAALLLVIAACVLAGFYSQHWLLDSEKKSDYFVEQMMEAVRRGSADKMYPLYTHSVPREQVDRDYQNLVQAWGDCQGYTFEKTGIRIRSTTEEGMGLKQITCAYAIDMGDGEKMGLNTMRIERSDGRSGLVSVTLLPAAPVEPYGSLETANRWNIIQWGLFVLSVLVFISTAATAAVCYRKCRRFRWLWIGLILLLYASSAAALVSAGGTQRITMGGSLALAGFSSLIIYPGEAAALRIRVPLGMLLYWGLSKRLSSGSRS